MRLGFCLAVRVEVEEEDEGQRELDAAADRLLLAMAVMDYEAVDGDGESYCGRFDELMEQTGFDAAEIANLLLYVIAVRRRDLP